MRIATANKNRRRVAYATKMRGRRLRFRQLLTAQEERWLAGLPALRKLFDDSGALGDAALLSPLPINRRPVAMDFAKSGGDRTVIAFGGAAGGGKSWAWELLRERLERGEIMIDPSPMVWIDEAAVIKRWPRG